MIAKEDIVQEDTIQEAIRAAETAKYPGSHYILPSREVWKKQNKKRLAILKKLSKKMLSSTPNTPQQEEE